MAKTDAIITMRVTNEFKARLEAEAQKERRSVSNLIFKVMEEYLDQQEDQPEKVPTPNRVGTFSYSDYSSAIAFAAAMAFSWAGAGHSSYRTKCRVKEPLDWVMARRSMA